MDAGRADEDRRDVPRQLGDRAADRGVVRDVLLVHPSDFLAGLRHEPRAALVDLAQRRGNVAVERVERVIAVALRIRPREVIRGVRDERDDAVDRVGRDDDEDGPGVRLPLGPDRGREVGLTRHGPDRREPFGRLRYLVALHRAVLAGERTVLLDQPGKLGEGIRRDDRLARLRPAEERYLLAGVADRLGAGLEDFALVAERGVIDRLADVVEQEISLEAHRERDAARLVGDLAEVGLELCEEEVAAPRLDHAADVPDEALGLRGHEAGVGGVDHLDAALPVPRLEAPFGVDLCNRRVGLVREQRTALGHRDALGVGIAQHRDALDALEHLRRRGLGALRGVEEGTGLEAVADLPVRLLGAFEIRDVHEAEPVRAVAVRLELFDCEELLRQGYGRFRQVCPEPGLHHRTAHGRNGRG